MSTSHASSSTSRPRSRRTTLLGAVVAATSLVTACGIPLDDAPRAIEVTTTTTSSGDSDTNTSGKDTVHLFFLRDDALTAVATEGSAFNPTQVLTSLFAGVPTSADSEVSTQIPNGVKLLGISVNNGSITLDVSADFDNLVGPGRTLALAQIVMTVTGLPDITSVAMRIEGSPVPMYSPETGDTIVVTECDYRSMLPESVGGISTLAPTGDGDGDDSDIDSATSTTVVTETSAAADEGSTTVQAPESSTLTDTEQYLVDRITAINADC